MFHHTTAGNAAHPSGDPNLMAALANYSRFMEWMHRDPIIGGGFTKKNLSWQQPKRRPWWFGLLEMELLTLEPTLHDDVRLVKQAQHHGRTRAENYGPDATASLICFLVDKYKKKTQVFNTVANGIRASMLWPTPNWDAVWDQNGIEQWVKKWQQSGQSQNQFQSVNTSFGPVMVGPAGPEVRGAPEYRDPFAKAVCAFVQNHFPYAEEVFGVELIRTPLKILWDFCYAPYVASCDCDDLTCITNLLLESMGIPTAVMLAGDSGGGPKYHVYSIYQSDPRTDTWKVCDASSPTPFVEMKHGGNFKRYRTNNPEDWMPIVQEIMARSR